jgi:hypothetical protein
LFLKKKKEIIRTLKYCNAEEAIHDVGQSANTMRKNIEQAIIDLTTNNCDDHVFVMLNLKEDYNQSKKKLSWLVRFAAGLLGITCIAFLVKILFTYFQTGNFIEDWYVILSFLIAGPFLIRAVITGNGDLAFLYIMLKRKTRSRTKIETGQQRWPKRHHFNC